MRFNSVAKWLSWQERLHPSAIDLGLDRVKAVYQSMGLAKPAPLIITVGGTNGKGSCVAMLSTILRFAGYRIGTYTSPHLFRYNERICVNGEQITDDELCTAFQRVDQSRYGTSLTYFEFGTLAAFYHFANQGLDAVVLEVGLGGRLDAVNILDADVSLITTIDIDHVEWLGDDRGEIAVEKAGILRPGRSWVCGDPQPPEVLVELASRIGARGFYLHQDYTFSRQDVTWSWSSDTSRLDELKLPALGGDFQLQNAATVLKALELVQAQLPVARSTIDHALGGLVLIGRFQHVPGEPRQIFDVAHNPHAAKAVRQALQNEAFTGKTYAVVAMLADKDITGVFKQMLPVIDEWYLGGVDMPRGASGQDLYRILQDIQRNVPSMVYDTPAQAHGAALRQARATDRIIIFGSFYSVAEVLLSNNDSGV